MFYQNISVSFWHSVVPMDWVSLTPHIHLKLDKSGCITYTSSPRAQICILLVISKYFYKYNDFCSISFAVMSTFEFHDRSIFSIWYWIAAQQVLHINLWVCNEIMIFNSADRGPDNTSHGQMVMVHGHQSTVNHVLNFLLDTCYHLVTQSNIS